MTKSIFSNIREEISQYLQKATFDILVAVAWFTDDILFNQLKEALERGITITIILNDDDINQFSGLNFSTLKELGANVLLYDINDNTMHQKFCIIDKSIVIVGSYNWTKKAATRNTENVIILENDTTVAGNFISQFAILANNCRPFQKKQKFSLKIDDQILVSFEPITKRVITENLLDSNQEIETFNSEKYINPELIPFRLDDKWGFCDFNKNIKIPFLFDEVNAFSEGIAAVKVDDNWGFIDADGRKITDCIYDKVQDFVNGYASVKKRNFWGCVDRNGEIIIPIKYCYVGEFHQGLFLVMDFINKWGYIDKHNNVIIPIKYAYAKIFSEEIACVKFSYFRLEKNIPINHSFCLNRKNELIFEQGFSNLEAFHNGYCVVGFNDGSLIRSKWGLINKTGNYIIPPEYASSHYMISQNLLSVSKIFKKIGEYGEYEIEMWGFIDVNNTENIPFNFYNAGHFSNNLAPVQNEKRKYGYIGLNGKLLIDYKFDYAFSFRSNLAQVNIGEQKGYIDKTGFQYWE